MVILNKQIRDKIADHGKRDYPHECCGFLFGRDHDERREIIKALPVENIHSEDQRRRFQVSPKDYMKAETFADENDMEFLGIYHSHPDHPSVPSEHDLKQAVPFFSYFILSVKNGQPDTLQSWKLNSENIFQEEKLKIENQ
ncbi:MAG: M67 family metallopeptidase [Saprospiraceae bacterium]|nr:M67 family metallopeptidase [Saprospiraceae bacterium]